MQDISNSAVEAAKTEFWRVLAIKQATLDDAWRAAITAARKADQQGEQDALPDLPVRPEIA